MTALNLQPIDINPELDLVLRVETHLTPDKIWHAWTDPELLKQWFCPKPWGVDDCEIDPRPGGRFYTRMVGPNGESFAGEACILEAVENRRLVWCTSLLPGYRPKTDIKEGEFYFTAYIDMEPTPTGTIYTSTLLHADKESCDKHRDMGFESGWGKAFQQLVELMS